MVTQDRVERAAEAYLRALISASPATTIVKAIMLGDSGGFSKAELAEISRGSMPETRTTSRTKTKRSVKVAVPKQKRKISKYQKRFGVHLKRLKRAHPRTNISVLMKKAHRATKREMKK